MPLFIQTKQDDVSRVKCSQRFLCISKCPYAVHSSATIEMFFNHSTRLEVSTYFLYHIGGCFFPPTLPKLAIYGSF